jgi:hypothetical protein
MLWLYEGPLLEIAMYSFPDEEFWLVGCLRFETRMAQLHSLKASAV